jgi:hypothetical protein
LRVPAGARPGDVFLETRSIKLERHAYRADAGTLVVPENRAAANARLIALPIVCIRSPSVKPGAPIFWLEGGPGMSNMRFRPPQSLLTAHDVVMVGYRGVDGSVMLDAPEVRSALRSG